MSAARRPPAGLGPAGRKLWRDVQEPWTLRPDEERLLVAAARTLDELGRLQKALAGAPPIVEGSQGQVRPHPLYAEVRAHRLVLCRLLTAVGLDEDAAIDGTERSHAGRQLARKRWQRRGGAVA